MVEGSHVPSVLDQLCGVLIVTENSSSIPIEWTHIASLVSLLDHPETSKKERIIAIETLLRLYHTQIKEFERKERDAIDKYLMQTFATFGLRIFAKSDPLMAMAEFLGRKEKRGKRAKNTVRDFELAVEVAQRMADGNSLDDAAFAVADAHKDDLNLSAERIENIYKANRSDARAHVALCKFEMD